MDQKVHDDLPEHWLDCPPMATQLMWDCFIVCKTPISGEYDDVVLKESRFTPQMVFDLCRNQKIKPGLWIDLTYTGTSYNRTEIEMEGWQYENVPCENGDEPPTEQQTLEFLDCVGTFLKNDKFGKVVVHCTYGFNTTGYMIASYMVKQEGYKLQEVLDIFAETRTPGIYEDSYMQALGWTTGWFKVLRSPAEPHWLMAKNKPRHETNESAICNKKATQVTSIICK